ncbi:unnamed protein product, partial [Ectocarpus sp. 12 AP-2014]
CPTSPNLFATTGAGHILTVWDTSDVFEPLCSIPVKTQRCSGTSVRWGPGGSGIWVSASTRPFIFFLDFFEGALREVLFRDHATQSFSGTGPRGGPGNLPAVVQEGRGVRDVVPLEDATYGLDVMRKPGQPDHGQSIHLAAWTAPSGQIRVSAARCREVAPSQHHHLAAAFLEQCRKSKKSQRLQLLEHRVMHRLEYVRPGDRLVDQGDPWCTAAGDRVNEAAAEARASWMLGAVGAGARAGPPSMGGGTAADPYLRVFTGAESEGLLAIKWHEAMPPLSGLLDTTPGESPLRQGRFQPWSLRPRFRGARRAGAGLGGTPPSDRACQQRQEGPEEEEGSERQGQEEEEEPRPRRHGCESRSQVGEDGAGSKRWGSSGERERGRQ